MRNLLNDEDRFTEVLANSRASIIPVTFGIHVRRTKGPLIGIM